MLPELQTEKTLIIDRCFQKYSLNGCLVCSFISLGTMPFLCVHPADTSCPKRAVSAFIYKLQSFLSSFMWCL